MCGSSRSQNNLLMYYDEYIHHAKHIQWCFYVRKIYPGSKLRWLHVGPTWILLAQRWAYVGPTCYLGRRAYSISNICSSPCYGRRERREVHHFAFDKKIGLMMPVSLYGWCNSKPTVVGFCKGTKPDLLCVIYQYAGNILIYHMSRQLFDASFSLFWKK